MDWVPMSTDALVAMIAGAMVAGAALAALVAAVRPHR